MTRRLLCCAIVLAWIAGVGMIPPAGAAFSGGNGLLAVAPGDPAGFNPLGLIRPDLVQSGFSFIPGTDEFVSPAWSRSGKRLAATHALTYNIYVLNPDGTGRRKLTNEPPIDESADGWFFYNVMPSWAPAGDRIVFGAIRNHNWDIYTTTTGTTPVQRRLTSNAAADTRPAWSPDGSRIAFVSTRNGNEEIYLMNADGTGLKRLTFNAESDRSPAWSPDGTTIVFSRDARLFTYELSTNTVRPLSTAGAVPDYGHPAYSPDGMYIAATHFGDRYAVLEADGTFLRESSDDGAEPDWQPLTCTKSGTSGADVIVGTSGADIICGKGGNDSIDGRGGNDTIFGDGGNDTIKGGAGTDSLVGGSGADNLQGGDGFDRCDGGVSTDPTTTSCDRIYRVP